MPANFKQGLRGFFYFSPAQLYFWIHKTQKPVVAPAPHLKKPYNCNACPQKMPLRFLLSLLAVKGNKVDLASTSNMNRERGNGKGWNTEQDFRVIWQSELLLSSPMAYRKDLPVSLKEAFISYRDPAGLEQLKVYGYAPATDAAYNPIRGQIEVKKQLSDN